MWSYTARPTSPIPLRVLEVSSRGRKVHSPGEEGRPLRSDPSSGKGLGESAALEEGTGEGRPVGSDPTSTGAHDEGGRASGTKICRTEVAQIQGAKFACVVD